MMIPDEEAQTLRAEYGPGDFYEARVITNLLDDREELLRYKAGFEESEKMLGWTNRRIEKLERVVAAAREFQATGWSVPTGIELGDAAVDRLDIAIRALDEEEA